MYKTSEIIKSEVVVRVIFKLIFKNFLLINKKMSNSQIKIGRPTISDEKKKENSEKNKKVQLQKKKDKVVKYREMGLILKKGRYSKAYNDEQKKLFFEKHGIIV